MRQPFAECKADTVQLTVHADTHVLDLAVFALPSRLADALVPVVPSATSVLHFVHARNACAATQRNAHVRRVRRTS